MDPPRGKTILITRPAVERRQQPRVQLEEDLIVRIHKPSDHDAALINFSTRDAQLFDINNLGAFVSTDLALQKGASVDIEIELPGMQVPTLVHAQVARQAQRLQRGDRVTPRGLGLRFLAESFEEQERIRRIVMTTLILDLMKYGYEHHKTIHFWRDVFTRSQLPTSDWRPPHVESTVITSSTLATGLSVGLTFPS